MSKTEQPIDDFEYLLESFSPAEANGSPMQIMYLAGQQSVGLNKRFRAPNRIWQLATLVSSTVAAGLLVVLTVSQLSQSSGQSIVQSDAIEDGELVADVVVEQGSGDSKSLSSTLLHAPSKRSSRMPLDPMRLAQIRMPQSSIDMFDDFEIKPLEVQGWKQEYPQ